MKALVIGSGGREHALVKALSQSSSISEVHAIPGNEGMREALCHSMDWKEIESLIQFCLRTEIDFVFIGPEDPLVYGLADRLRERGILVIGPSAEAARLEGSKIFAKHFMGEAKIPTSHFCAVTNVAETLAAASQFTPPYVFKADGLAAGKGVYICKNLAELEIAARQIFEEKILGAAGKQALLEQFMPGWELSFLVLTNGTDFKTLPLAQDHKRLLDGDQGPNTGGMGVIAPLRIDQELRYKIEQQIVLPTLQALQSQNMLYRGVLYFGLMITSAGPQLLEYNCRFGDPETQVILPLLDADLGILFKDLAAGKISEFKEKNKFASCVVMASPGYPDKPERGVKIEGDLSAETSDSYFIIAGAKKSAEGQWQTSGGRVLCSIGLGTTLQESLDRAYQQSESANWFGLQKRRDIGKNLI